jgi:hypothetical protein
MFVEKGTYIYTEYQEVEVPVSQLVSLKDQVLVDYKENFCEDWKKLVIITNVDNDLHV